MALSDSTVSSIQAAKTAVEEWRDRRVAEIEDQAEFLASVELPTSRLSENAHESAVESAQVLIDSIVNG